MDILVKKARNKDPDAFVELMELHMQSMYKIAKSYLKNDEDVADAIQDTILTCFERIESLKQIRFFKTWMTRILINKCNDKLRREREVYLGESLIETAVWEEEYTNLEWCELLHSIDEKYRTVLLLYYVEGFQIKEISKILDMKESTVRTRLSRGRDKVSEEFNGVMRRSNA